MIKLFNKLAKVGLKLPMAYDHRVKGPSINLLILYIATILSIVSIISLHKNNHLEATIATLTFWAVANVFYAIRKLTSAKFDLDDKSVELSNEDKDE